VAIDNQKPGSGGQQQQPQYSANVGVKRSRDSNQNSAAAALKAIRRHCTGPSQFSHFVFTPLADAIREWDSQARQGSPLNILATVKMWGKPKESKGVNSSNIFAKTPIFCTRYLHVV
jgi:hypothetical protein